MRHLAFASGFLLAVAGAAPVGAQAPETAPLELSDGGRAYIETVGRRVDADVVYYDPNGAAPELTTQEQPETSKGTGGDPTRHLPDNFFTILALFVLAVIAVQVWRNGAPVSVSLRARPKDASRTVRGGGQIAEEEDQVPPELAEILAMDNLNLAIVALARSALTRAAEQSGMRWQTSWTARELLRRLPREMADRLRPLVRSAEHVQFGNRDIGADDFARFARDVGPLLGGGAT